MTPNEYQLRAAATAIYPLDQGVNYCIHGLTNEAGEVSGKYKKYLRMDYGYNVMREKVLDECGDVLWYVSNLARELDCTLEELMTMNLMKLRDRKDRGVIAGDGDKR